MKRPISQRRESVQDYQRPIRRRQFSPSPIKKSQSSRIAGSRERASKVHSQSAAFQAPCTTNNKENYGFEPEIKVQADRQKKTPLIDLKRQGFPTPMSKQKSFDEQVQRMSGEKVTPAKVLGDTHNLARATSFQEPNLKHSPSNI